MAPKHIEFGVGLLDGIAAEGHLTCTNSHPIANALHRKKVGRPNTRSQQVDQGGHLQILHTDGTAKKRQDLRTVFFFETGEFFGNFIQSPIPRNGLEITIDAFQWRGQPIRTIDNLQGIGPFGTKPARIYRVRFQTSYFNGLSIFDGYPASTAVVAQRTVSENFLLFFHCRTLSVLLGN